MSDIKVMVVDDSAAMRALFCGILENASGIEVCGLASNAADAREKMVDAAPDVLTLDVEMPGMSGIDFLQEIMEERPMPVIMLSSITQAGTGTAKRALELGAVHCFPKPLQCSGDEFNATVEKLGDIVRKAAAGELEPTIEEETEEPDIFSSYEPDDSLVVLCCGTAGLESAKHSIAALPANCPATLLLMDADPESVEECFRTVRGSLACEFVDAQDGMEMKPGRVILAHRKSHHVMIEKGTPPRVREVVRDPIEGVRPSADLLFGSLARTGRKSVAGLLVGQGRDGTKGLKMLAGTQVPVCVEEPADGEPRDRFDGVKALGIPADTVIQANLAEWILGKTDATATAAAA